MQNFLIYIVIYLILMPLLSHGHDYSIDNLLIEHPRIIKNKNNAKGYLIIRNSGKEDVFLINAKSYFSLNFKFHKENGRDKEMEVIKKIKIPANSEISLKDLNYHLMFYNYDKSLNWFDSHMVKLFFNNNKHIEVNFDVDY